jgi:hypothetical protein
MELVRSMFGWLMGGLLVFAGLFLLYSIVRYSIISPWLTRGDRQRLRTPVVDGMEKACGFEPQAGLVRFYETCPFVERMEFYLVDRAAAPPASWEIGAFIPLHIKDIRESQKIMRVPGIPIATDMDKGTYYIGSSGAVMLMSPNAAGGHVIVAPSIEHFSKFFLQDYHSGV